MFYDRFLELCEIKGVKPTNACVAAGLSRGLAAKWKSVKTDKPSVEALEKLSVYFGMSIDEIMGNSEEDKKENHQIRQDQEVSESFKELLGMMKDAPEDDLRLLIKMYQAIRSERNNG